MPTPRFLYFDLGNVLFHFDHSLVCKQVASVAKIPVGDVEAFFASAEFAVNLELGRATAKEVYDRFCREFHVAPEMKSIMRAGSDIFQLNAPMVPLLSRLAMSSQRMGILSNTSAPHWNFLNGEQYAILPNLFEVTVLSYQVHSMKPDADIYRVASRKAGVPPAEIFFTDDKPENVAAAVDAGWQAVVFHDPHDLEEELRRRGVQFN